MQVIEYATSADPLRDRKLHRLIDLYAADEAAAALRAAAARDRIGFLVAADALLTDNDDDVARERLRKAVASSGFLSLVSGWVRELREAANGRPDSGACTVATALELWSWTAQHVPQAIDEIVDVLCPLIAARCFALALSDKDKEPRRDLSNVYAAHAAASAGTTCAELVFGFRRHLVWDAEGCASCYGGADIDDLEALMPGIASGARMATDVVEADGSHTPKAGPCAGFEGLDDFMRLRHKLDGCLTGARLAKDRAAAVIGRSEARA